jgi:hypothetical protein
MKNPWLAIPYSDYESHMSDPSVGQTQKLDEIFGIQYNAYSPETLVILGIGTGNGLRHVDPAKTRHVIGIDINESYLQVCSDRYKNPTYDLVLLRADITKGLTQLPAADLIIGNLILEYIDVAACISILPKILRTGGIFSTVIQVNNGESFVSQSSVDSVKRLQEFHRAIEPDFLIAELRSRSLECIDKGEYSLPGQKIFLRLDFRKP